MVNERKKWKVSEEKGKGGDKNERREKGGEKRVWVEVKEI